MRSIEVHGKASQKLVKAIPYSDEDLQTDLLTWLRGHGITIASSCDGEGICKKCVIQNDWLTCELTLKEFLQRQPDQKIYVSYL